MLVAPQELKGEKFISTDGTLLNYRCTQNIINQKVFFQKDALLFVLNGCKHLICKSQGFVLEANECLFIPKGTYTFSNITSKDSYKAIIFFFEDKILLTKPQSNLMPKSSQASFPANKSLIHFFHSLQSQKEMLCKNDFLSLKFKELFLLLSHYHFAPTASFLNHISSRQHTLLNKLSSKDYLFESVETMAQELKLSPSLFSKKFKSEVGISPKEWLDSLRLSQAKTMLLLGDKSIAQIATDLNFSSCAWFIKRFKENYGLTPKQFQKNTKNSYFSS